MTKEEKIAQQLTINTFINVEVHMRRIAGQPKNRKPTKQRHTIRYRKGYFTVSN